MAATEEQKVTPRGGMVSVRLGDDEQALVRLKASEKGESISQFIRDAVMRQCRPEAAVDYRLYPAGYTASSSGLVLEAHGDQLVPRASSDKPYVSQP